MNANMMKSVVVQEDGTLQVKEIAKPQLSKADDVLVKVAYSGLCGSDIPRIFAKGAHFYPMVLGHEFSGKIVDIGKDVSDVKAGDPIACVPLLPCFQCEACRRHYYSLCKHYQFVGSRSFGGNAEYVVINRKNVLVLPDSVTLLEGAFFEPVTVGLHALVLANGCKDKHVTVIGAGTIGLLAMQCAKALGAASITAIDINDEKLVLAKQLGADYTYNSAQLSAEQIRQQSEERHFDQLILETAGAPQTVTLSLDIAGPRAQIALVGTLHRDLSLPYATFGQILRKELTIIGSWMNYSGQWPGQEWQIAADLFAKKALTLEPLIASINDPEGFSQHVTQLHGQPMTGKIMLKFD